MQFLGRRSSLRAVDVLAFFGQNSEDVREQQNEFAFSKFIRTIPNAKLRSLRNHHLTRRYSILAIRSTRNAITQKSAGLIVFKGLRGNRQSSTTTCGIRGSFRRWRIPHWWQGQ